MTKTILFRLALFTTLILILALPVSAEQWQEDAEKLCSSINDAKELTKEALKDLISDCDEMIKKIEAIDNPKKKVYLFRLKKCRNFYKFTLDMKDSQEAEDKGAGSTKKQE